MNYIIICGTTFIRLITLKKTIRKNVKFYDIIFMELRFSLQCKVII